MNFQVFKDGMMSYKIHSAHYFFSEAIYIYLLEDQLSFFSRAKCAKPWFFDYWFHFMSG